MRKRVTSSPAGTSSWLHGQRDDLPRPMMCLVDMGAGGLVVFPVALMRPRLSGTVDSVHDVATTCSGEECLDQLAHHGIHFNIVLNVYDAVISSWYMVN
uniref:Uncharacterized protein n=1 Tax=Oryza sativa subsp. japonica TaxID=39947 RepID=Q6UU86_ORYSJ|nr:hypothetical protein OSJNBa0074N12.3 [Oryza sativa Japonica Group]AAQ56474.1 hypothetical protein OSJNBa0023H09.11 [Oryza sativa Japonica Group]